MKEINGNIWKIEGTYRVITVNGIVNKNTKRAVMGIGNASEAKERFPGIDKELGIKLLNSEKSKHVFLLSYGLIAFQTKHHWKEMSDINLIQESAKQLNEFIIVNNIKGDILMPPPGCGNGGLNWKDVKKVIDFLPDNVIIIHKNFRKKGEKGKCYQNEEV